ncbi:MAG: dTMP kinase [Sporolactobacillus sp.]
MHRRGQFITFEGPDGSGKSTQIRYLADYLRSRQIPYLLTREPGGTALGDQIRAMVLNPDNACMVDQTEILLYAAARSQHVREKIEPALADGQMVLCDRFTDASLAYQGYGLAQDVSIVKQINRFATGGLEPDRTFLIDVSPETGRERMRHRKGDAERGATQQASDLDRIEARALAYHRSVREGFLTIYRENKQRITLIDGEQEPLLVYQSIVRQIDALLAIH